MSELINNIECYNCFDKFYEHNICYNTYFNVKYLKIEYI